MKTTPAAALSVACFLSLTALAGALQAAVLVPARWDVETSRAHPAQFDCYRGESLELKASLYSYGVPLSWCAGASSPALYWQTNGMGTAYWSAPATASSNAVTAVWLPAYDTGAAYYNCFIGSPGSNYRAAFRLRMLPAPGAVPNELEPPVRTIDFATVEVLNAPWATPGDLEPLRAELGSLSDSVATNGILYLTLHDATATNANAIATLSVSILTNSAAIATNSAAISTLTDSILTLNDATSTLNDAISTLNDSISLPTEDWRTSYWTYSDYGVAAEPSYDTATSKGYIIYANSRPGDAAYLAKYGTFGLAVHGTRNGTTSMEIDSTVTPGFEVLGYNTDYIDMLGVTVFLIRAPNDYAMESTEYRVYKCGLMRGQIYDSAPTKNSVRPVTSGGVKTALDSATNALASTLNSATNALATTLNSATNALATTLNDAKTTLNDSIFSAATAATNYTDSATSGLLRTESDPVWNAQKANYIPGTSGYYRTAAGATTDYLLSGTRDAATGDLTGGVRLRYSSMNEANLTGYGYEGITARRNAANTRYKFDNSDDGIARFRDLPDLSDYATTAETGNAIRDAANAMAAAERVLAFVYGTGTVITVTNYDWQVTGKLPHFKIEDRTDTNNVVTVYDSTLEHTDTLAKANTYAESLYTDPAWSTYASGTGQPAPEGVTWISTPETVLAGGLEFSKTVTTGGAVWFLTYTGMVGTQAATTNGYMTISAMDGTTAFTFRKGASYTVGCDAGSVVYDGSTFVVTYTVAGLSTHPTIYATAALDNASRHWVDPTALGITYSWSQSGTTYTCTLNLPQDMPQCFFTAEAEVQGENIIEMAAPVSGGILCTDGIHKCRPVWDNGSITWQAF